MYNLLVIDGHRSTHSKSRSRNASRLIDFTDTPVSDDLIPCYIIASALQAVRALSVFRR